MIKTFFLVDVFRVRTTPCCVLELNLVLDICLCYRVDLYHCHPPPLTRLGGGAIFRAHRSDNEEKDPDEIFLGLEYNMETNGRRHVCSRCDKVSGLP